MDVDIEEGEVVTQLNHHKSGKTQLARDVFTHIQLEKIFRNPRVHTGNGRHVEVEIGSESLYAEDKENDQTNVSPVISTPFSSQFVQEVVQEVRRQLELQQMKFEFYKY